MCQSSNKPLPKYPSPSYQINIWPRAIYGKDSKALKRKWPMATCATGSSFIKRQPFSPFSSAGTSSNTPAGRCTILWMQSYANSVSWTQSRLKRDYGERIRQAKERNALDEVADWEALRKIKPKMGFWKLSRPFFCYCLCLLQWKNY